jgi:hypothetical protein
LGDLTIATALADQETMLIVIVIGIGPVAGDQTGVGTQIGQ